MTEAAGSEGSPATPFKPIYGGYVLAMVVVGLMLNFLDRQILTLLLPAIKAEFNASDTALGLLSGFAFAIFYVTLGIPIARAADRTSRSLIISASIGVWSFATALCGLAQNFTQLVLARIGVGVGEAGFTPAAMSMVADYYPRRYRATALGIANLGVPLGMVAGLLVGGIGLELLGWRGAFLVAGVPGLLFAIAFWLTVREPARGAIDGLAPPPAAKLPLLQSLGVLLRAPTYVFIVLGNAATCMGLYGLSTWMPSFLVREFDIAPSSVGYMMAPALGLAGAIGVIAGGLLSDALSKRTPAAAMLLCAAASALAIPAGAMALLSGTPIGVVTVYGVAYMLGLLYSAPTLNLLCSVVPIDMRAFATSILLFVVNLIGLGLGPVIVGALSDHFAPSDNALRDAMLIMTGVYAMAALFYLIASTTAQRDVERIESA